MKLIVGLGNPGREYENNRHNIGFMCLSYLARQHRITLDRKQGLARVGRGVIAGEGVVLARPQTYMNSSGESVSRLVRALSIDLSDLIIIHDDMDLPLGKMRIRQGGSSAGHKGLQSIIEHLGNPDFIRVKIGIGRPDVTEAEDKEARIVEYVLNDFTTEEQRVISGIIPGVGEALVCFLAEGLAAAMNRFN